jgi:hypothetical protein
MADKRAHVARFGGRVTVRKAASKREPIANRVEIAWTASFSEQRG